MANTPNYPTEEDIAHSNAQWAQAAKDRNLIQAQVPAGEGIPSQFRYAVEGPKSPLDHAARSEEPHSR